MKKKTVWTVWEKESEESRTDNDGYSNPPSKVTKKRIKECVNKGIQEYNQLSNKNNSIAF